MTFLRRIFGALRPAYLVRSYLIGLVLLGLMIGFFTSVAAKESGGSPVGMYIYFALCTLLFPFAKLTWDELRKLAFGDNVIVLNAALMLFLKFVINVLLWGFAVFVAPFGLLYLWLRTHAPRKAASEWKKPRTAFRGRFAKRSIGKGVIRMSSDRKVWARPFGHGSTRAPRGRSPNPLRGFGPCG